MNALGAANHSHTGIAHSPVESRTVLPIATPLPTTTGSDQFIVSLSGSSP